MTEYNRNLSSVIQSIRDKGPSSPVEERVSGVRDSVHDRIPDEPVAQGGYTGRSVLQIFLIAVLAGLLVAGGVLFVTGGGGGYLSGVLDDPSTAPTTGEQAVDGRLAEISEEQAQLGSRVDQLSAAIADINIIIRQWHEQQGSGKLAVQDNVQPGRKDRSPGARPDVPIQQGLLSSRNKEVVETTVAKADDLPVPQDEMNATAVARPDAVATSGIQADKAAINEPDPAAVTRPGVDTVVAEPDPVEQGWVINVAYSGKQAPIQKLKAKLGEAGITTEETQVTIGGRSGYRLRIPGFSTSREAREYARKNLGKDLGLKDPWVSRREQ